MIIDYMKSFTRSSMHVLGLSLVLFAVACEDNNDSSEEEGHTDADGFILEANGTEIYRQLKGVATGSVTLKVGADLDLSVHFLDEDGNEIEHEEEEDDHDDHGDEEEKLQVSGFNASIATVEFVEDDGHNHRKISLNLRGQEEEEHAMMLEVKGVGAGSTSFKLELMHGDHADFTSTINVPVVVTAN
ncbi:MAG: hypothetical protein VX144_02140 [Candidatus Neomarinimicrobiota bacterium]|nr:hypothetical protein [Candidatus Neomarinimicrobiota bacterium]